MNVSLPYVAGSVFIFLVAFLSRETLVCMFKKDSILGSSDCGNFGRSKMKMYLEWQNSEL
jgi:hypothetical protein